MKKSKVKIEIENSKLIQEITDDLFKQLGIKADVVVEEKEDVFRVQIETPESGILIGYHGETLSGLQLILSLIIYKKLDRWIKLVVNIGDYRQRREEILQQMALSSAEKVVSLGEPVVFTDLSSFERRIIHLALIDHPRVTSISEGEGRERKLVVKLKT